MKKFTLHKIYDVTLILVFSFLIYTPFFMGIIQDDLIASSMEKRNLAKVPPLPESLQTIMDYPEKA
ncbi:MAG: hypothetical protein Q9N32_08780 [Gammaproteobacteria bacterium]|nr:hypothetical protein [Gammaproteobacteria bacterium]